MKRIIFLVVMMMMLTIPVFSEKADDTAQEVVEEESDDVVGGDVEEVEDDIIQQEGEISSIQDKSDYIVMSGSSAGLNSFLIFNVKEKKAYTYNAYGNGGGKWKYQDLSKLEPRSKKKK